MPNGLLVASGLKRPPAADGAEVRQGEIGKNVRLAISAGPKKWQRIRRKVRRGDRFSSGVDPSLAFRARARRSRSFGGAASLQERISDALAGDFLSCSSRLLEARRR